MKTAPERPWDYEYLIAHGWVDSVSVARGRAVKTGQTHPAFDLVEGYMLREDKWVENADTSCQCQGTIGIAEPCADPTCYLRKSRCTVDGQPVAELAVLIKPVAFLVTVEHGTHELTRVYYHKDKFAVGVNTERLGGIGIGNVDYRTQAGLRITWAHGYEMFIPSAHCQATWKLPE